MYGSTRLGAFRLGVCGAGVILLMVIALLLVPATTQAALNGGCAATATASKSGSINLATASTWHVRDADVITGGAAAPTAQTTAQLKVALFGIGLPLVNNQGNNATGSVGPYVIADYDRYTRVLSVVGSSNTCSGSVLIIVDDVAPLSTWAGIIGVIAAVLGILGLLATMVQSPNGAARIAGFVIGLVAGLGIGLLLQQTAILDPANFMGLLLPLGGAVFGFVLAGIAHRGGASAARPTAA